MKYIFALTIGLLVTTVANAQEAPKNSGPINVLYCGNHPVFEYLNDMDGQFYYKKQVVEWKQGHANALRPVKLTTKRIGDECTLSMTVGSHTKTYKYKVCATSERGARCKARLNEITDVTPSPVVIDAVARKCKVGFGDKTHDYEDALAKCTPPKPQTVASNKYVPPACKNTSTGVLLEPYTCDYLTQPQFEELSEYNGKVCENRNVSGICSAKVKCDWNNSIPRAGHVLSYNTYVYCPSVGGKCRMSAMSCGADTSLYFDDDQTVKEMMRSKYNIPASAK